MKKNLGMLTLIMAFWFTISFITNILGPLIPDIIHNFNLSDLAMAGFIPTSFFLAYAIMSIPAGLLIDRFGEKPVLFCGFLMPFIGMILAGVNFNSLGVTIPWGNKPFLAIGSFLNAVITFLLTAVCVFILVKVMNAFRRKKEDKPKEPPKPTKEEELLAEIRDLLKAQQEEKN